MDNPFSNKLYLKISVTLLILLVLLGVGYLLITAFTARHFIQEANQRLYGNIASHTVKEVKPFVNGQLDTMAIKDIMHSLMVVNPSIEVYLLDTRGNIITYAAPYKKIKLEKVDLQPVQSFIENPGERLILGDDPRHPGKQKVFSAAAIEEDGSTIGYAYVILASEEQASVTSTLFTSYILRLGMGMFYVTLFVAMTIGLLAIWFITKNLRKIMETVRRFKEGDYAARIAEEDKGDLVALADTFNGMAERIEDNIEKIKSVENLRQELIANVSHDLRTPLAIMRGYIETILMKEESLSKAEKRHYLELVLSSSERLAYLVSQLFEYSKLEANEIKPKKEPFFIADLAQDVFAKYQLMAEKKDIKITLVVPQSLPLVFADIALVERVLQNLMDNALKFTPSGGHVNIELKGYVQHVEVRISDTGPGIPESEQRFIFERYHKADNNRKSKGVGLGLAIAKKILEIHNATIQVASKPNAGSSFWFQLPAYNGS